MPEINLTYDIFIILFIAGGVAGFIDALAGGGGLITIPALLLAGLPPISAIATNKLQAVFGTLTASITVYQKNVVNKQDVFSLFFASLVGASLGAIALLFIDAQKLDIIIPIVLVSIALYFLFARNLNDRVQQEPQISRPLYRNLIIPIIGFYDGILCHR